MSKLSILIPTLNEANNAFFRQILETTSKLEETEVIVADGGSSDQTEKICTTINDEVQFLSCNTQSRAERLNQAIKQATGDVLLLHHPRSIAKIDAYQFLATHSDQLNWGGLWHNFDMPHLLLRFTSWYSNYIRGRLWGIVYLDHCIYLKKTMAQKLGKLPAVHIFEDTILSRRLRQHYGRPTILPFPVQTSSVRFQKNGVFKQSLLNQYLKLRFFFRANHQRMNQLYEKNVPLNSDYSKKPEDNR